MSNYIKLPFSLFAIGCTSLVGLNFIVARNSDKQLTKRCEELGSQHNFDSQKIRSSITNDQFYLREYFKNKNMNVTDAEVIELTKKFDYIQRSKTYRMSNFLLSCCIYSSSFFRKQENKENFQNSQRIMNQIKQEENGTARYYAVKQ